MDDNELKDYAREGARLQLQHILEVFPELAPVPVAAVALSTPKRKAVHLDARHAQASRRDDACALGVEEALNNERTTGRASRPPRQEDTS